MRNVDRSERKSTNLENTEVEKMRIGFACDVCFCNVETCRILFTVLKIHTDRMDRYAHNKLVGQYGLTCCLIFDAVSIHYRMDSNNFE